VPKEIIKCELFSKKTVVAGRSGKLMLTLISTAILGSESRGTRGYILLYPDSGRDIEYRVSLITLITFGLEGDGRKG
jgi:hypothetical protein